MFYCGSYARIDGNSACVDTGEIKISFKKLYTSFVYSCSVLTFNFNSNQNYMAHVDALGENMELKLYESLKNLPLNTVSEFNIYYGSLCKGDCKEHCRCKSMSIIRNVFVKLGLEKRKINEYNLDVWQTEVSIPEEKFNNNGTKSIIPSSDRIFLNTPNGTF